MLAVNMNDNWTWIDLLSIWIIKKREIDLISEYLIQTLQKCQIHGSYHSK